MELKKTYHDVNPELLYDEIKDFALNQGVTLGENKLETYSVAGDSSSFITRGNLTFKTRGGADKKGKECLRVHIVGSSKGETRVMIDADEKLFPTEKMNALQEDLDYFFTPYELTDAD
jgi:hypothetical protein